MKRVILSSINQDIVKDSIEYWFFIIENSNLTDKEMDTLMASLYDISDDAEEYYMNYDQPLYDKMRKDWPKFKRELESRSNAGEDIGWRLGYTIDINVFPGDSIYDKFQRCYDKYKSKYNWE